MITKTHSPEIRDFVRQSNADYLHWDKLRYHPLPEGVTPETAWVAVCISRVSQFQILPITFFGLDDSVKYWTPPKHLEWLHTIDTMGGGTIGAPSPDAFLGGGDKDRYLFSSLMEEAIASSQLEGASTTREAAKQMLRTQKKPRTKSEQMIANNYRAIMEIRELRSEKLTPELIKHLQAVITEDTLDNPSAAGRFRTPDEKITVCDVRTGDTIFTPPSAHSIEFRIDEICELANSKPDQFIHPVVTAIALHFAMGFVHPFVDGNGRTARAIFYWYMLKSNYWLFEYLPISRLFLRAPVRYAMPYLYTETDDGDLTYFLHYNLKMIVRAIKELHHYLEAQHEKMREAAAFLESYPGLNERQISLLYDCVRDSLQSYTVRQYQGIYSVTNNTARADLRELETRGLLRSATEGKQLVFYPVPHLLKRLSPTYRKRAVGVPSTDATSKETPKPLPSQLSLMFSYEEDDDDDGEEEGEIATIVSD